MSVIEPARGPLRRVVRWLRTVGLRAEEGTRYTLPFARGIWLEDGELIYDPCEAHPGDMLHEAGHLAVLPADARLAAQGDADEVSGFHDNDSEAIAWSYAAALACGVDPWLVFESGFTSREDAEEAFRLLRSGRHDGIAKLVEADFLSDAKEFPKLRRWLR
jgi:hypothetical protein